MHPKKYLMRLKLLRLGMPPCITFSINDHQFVLRHTIFLSLHALCAMLGASHSLIFSCFVFLDVHNKLDPNPNCVGEKHAPLHSRTQHMFSYLSFMCVPYLFVDVVMLSS